MPVTAQTDMHELKKLGTDTFSFWVLFVELGLLLATGCRTAGRRNEFSQWPAGTSPREIGTRVAENFASRKLGYQTDPGRNAVHYAEVCTWYGALTIAELTRDEDLKLRLIRKFDPLMANEAGKIPARSHVDDRVFGVVPLELFILTRDPKYLRLGRGMADGQWEKTTPDGISVEARYWIDDMYMITALQVQAYRATGETRYLDRAAVTMAAYLDRLQQPNGLFFHAPDSPFFWSRGNGWVAAGMTELLRSLPRNDPRRGRILEGYRKMMAVLLTFQGNDGVWRQLIDQPESWAETSSTGMFAFAMITGVKNGWLDREPYGPAARKAWLGLLHYLDREGNVSNICEGTGKGFSIEYYLKRQRKTGDFHGQAPVLWAASALLSKSQ
jgi:rhamnogalacturonyl hydrolase YesR